MFSTYGLQRALNATIRIPSADAIPSKSNLKDNRYRDYISERHDALARELDAANEEFDLIVDERDNHDIDADPFQAAKLNREYIHANSRLAKAEVEYHVFRADIDELRSTSQMTREESQLWPDYKVLEEDEGEKARAEDDSLQIAFQNNRLRLREAKEIIREMQKSDESLIRKIQHSSRNKVFLRGQLAQAEWGILETQQKGEAEIRHLRAIIEECGYYSEYDGSVGSVGIVETENLIDV